MSDQIDHVESAIQNGQAAEQTDDLQEAGVHAQHAIAHGILALVEQQRIANLIALADHAHTRWANYAGEAGGMGTLFSYGETENGNMRIRDDIREALGLS